MRILFVGDLMCHSSQISSYFDSKTKTYNSFKSFEYVADILQNANLTLGNLETTISDIPSEFSGYPRFASPVGYVHGLKKAGFDIVSTANNHSADTGSKGIDTTIRSVLENGMVPIGTYYSYEDYQNRKDFIQDVNGIIIAIYNYTYSTNGIPVRDGRVVRLLSEEQIKIDVSFAKENGAHFIILWYHYGTEYSETPDKTQSKWVNLGFEAGADIIIGGHPHVVQKLDFFQDQKANEQRLVAYSLGNFLSAQNRKFTDGGVILSITLSLELGKELVKKIEKVQTKSVWVDPRNYTIIPIQNYKQREIPIQLPKHLEKRMMEYESYLKKIPGIGANLF
nr:CapA family protein [Leptospira yanagawae]